MPSKKSKTAPRMMKAKAHSCLPSKAKHVAMQPEIRLQQVMELGMLRVMMLAMVSGVWR